MSTWIEENVIKNLNAFQLVVVLLAFFGNPYIAMIWYIIENGVSLYIAIIIVSYSVFLIVLALVGATVYRKNMDAKVATCDTAVLNPKEQFTIKQAIALIQGLVGINQPQQYVPQAEEPVQKAETVSKAEFNELKGIFLKYLETRQDG